ncbi:sensor histidine kinase [Granulicella arctica]|uniref:histidine kinase n=1 Tax=Granulicella arctica TaxID=940613 RepID=A0A7Y9TGZ7_9BACT|nr:sensor histidine kinase [Granulicella arctica]NYF80501.1 signal transduction histidine kinase [Granulicella arctica]
MKSQINRILVPSLLIAAILIVSLNAWFAFRSIDVLVHEENLVQHTWQVINQVERIMSSAKDAETGNRGFLVTGDDAYLDPYFSALQELPKEVDHLNALTLDNHNQQMRIIEMHAVLEQRISLLQQGINLRRSGRADSLHAIVLSGTGKMQMDHLREIADTMEGEEQRTLAVRTAQAKSSSRRTRATLGIASFIDFLLIILMFRYFAHERAMRLVAEDTGERLAIARAEAEANAAEVQALNTTLEERVRARTAELETTNRELEAFSYSVSHDLRAPLRTIDGFSLALEEDYASAVDAAGRDYIKRVRGGVQRMGELIDALLQLSRITRAAIVREHFDLSAIAFSVTADLREQNEGREIAFRIQNGLEADADPKLLRVALENLLGNAVKFSAKVSHAVIEFGWDAEQNAWFVRDNGAGFDMYYSEKLFNAFNRLHGDKDFKGSGIGLATVARVIRRHHGNIWADSVVGHGATFWFTLG